MKEQHRKKTAFVPIIGGVVRILFGLAIALGLMQMLMKAFPNWVPPEVRVNPLAHPLEAGIDQTYDLRQSDGDL